ncbi:MAG: CAP domain-containing protein, partial [Deinococcota bacterium]
NVKTIYGEAVDDTDLLYQVKPSHPVDLDGTTTASFVAFAEDDLDHDLRSAIDDIEGVTVAAVLPYGFRLGDLAPGAQASLELGFFVPDTNLMGRFSFSFVAVTDNLMRHTQGIHELAVQDGLDTGYHDHAPVRLRYGNHAADKTLVLMGPFRRYAAQADLEAGIFTQLPDIRIAGTAARPRATLLDTQPEAEPPSLASLEPSPSSSVDIEDTSLATAITQAANTAVLTPTALLGVTHLEAADAGINVLEGIQHAANLTHLDLSGNAISDIQPLTNLHQLSYLELANNALTDIQALVNNPGIDSRDVVNLSGNCLDFSSGSADLRALIDLETRGVTVQIGGQRDCDGSSVQHVSPLTTSSVEPRAGQIATVRYTWEVVGTGVCVLSFGYDEGAKRIDPCSGPQNHSHSYSPWQNYHLTQLTVTDIQGRQTVRSHSFLTSEAADLLQLTNDARSRPQECGPVTYPAAPPLRWNATLTAVASAHSEDMAARNFFAHVNPDGQTAQDRINASNYEATSSAENLAWYGHTSDYSTFINAWLASPGHCRNLMNPDFADIGVGYARDSSPPDSYNVLRAHYYTQIFATPH